MSGQPDDGHSSHNRSDNFHEDEISLLDLAIALARHKKLIVLFPLFIALISGIVTFFIPNSYTAQTKILPLAGAAPKETIISLLQSQPMVDSLITRFKLREVYHAETMEQTREKFTKVSKISTDKDGLIDISVKDRSPVRAALIANAYTGIFNTLMHQYGLTEASHRRSLLEKQLPDAQKAVVQAEQELVLLRQQSGDDIADAHVQALIKASGELKAKIAMKEIELFSMGSDPAKNPNYMRILQELSALWNDFASIGNDAMFKSKMSQKEHDYLQKVSTLEYSQTKYDQMLKQVEKAKYDELRETPTIQVLGKAGVPDRKSGPARTRIMVLSAFAAGFLVLLWVIVSEALQKKAEDEESGARFRLFLENLRWR